MGTAIRFLCLCMMAVLAMMLSCTDDFRPHVRNNLTGASASMRFSLNGKIHSRSDSDNYQDRDIDHAYVFFFTDEEKDSDSRLVAYTYASSSDDDASVLTFPIPDGMDERGQYHLLAMANADFFTPDGCENYEQFIQSLIRKNGNATSTDVFKKALRLHNTSILSDSNTRFLPLVGESTHENPFSFTKTGNGFEASESIAFDYSVCRVDIINNAVDDILLSGAIPCNLQTSFFPFHPESNSAETTSPDFSASNFIRFPEEDSPDRQVMAPAFFCFPNRSENPSQHDSNTTAVILSAFYRDPESDTFDSSQSYYRVNIINHASSQHLAPNYIYHLSISQVKGRGKATPQEAYAAPSSPLTISSSDPNVSISGDTISIQAFHPEIFNSFLSVPLQLSADTKTLGLSPADAEKLTFNISSDLQWPLEGIVGTANVQHLPNEYSLYRTNSFWPENEHIGYLHHSIPDNKTTKIPFNSPFYASVGCMGPDDPDIIRYLTVSASIAGKTYSSDFVIRIYARPVIIDDVILEIGNEHWLVCDRNVQISTYTSTLNPGYPDTAPSNHIKRQAYHYGSYPEMKIPFKLNQNGINASECELHPEATGYLFPYSLTSTELKTVIDEWKKLYTDNDKTYSPFYTEAEISNWTYPKYNAHLKVAWPQKLACSKCRLFFVSDVPAADSIPVCCWLPFHVYSFNNGGSASESMQHVKSTGTGFAASRYMSATTFSNLTSNYNIFFCCMEDDEDPSTQIKTGVESSTQHLKMIRLVRQLSDTELYEYKRDYLGCFGGELRLKHCHKDTYSEWPDNEKSNLPSP